MSEHAGFIIAAYAFTAFIVVTVILWTYFQHRAQSRALAALEAKLGRGA
jgi:heme exporter protein CcmD